MIPFSFLATQSTAFTPLSLPSLLNWIDGSKSSSVSLSGSNITAITDQSSNADNAAQATGANQPLYVANAQNGLHAINFDTSSKFMTMSKVTLNSKSAFSLCFLFKAPAIDGNSKFIFNGQNGGGSGRASVYVAATTNQLWADFPNISGEPLARTGALTGGTWYRIFVVYDSTQADPNKLKIYQNNVDVTVDAENGSGSTDSTIVAEYMNYNVGASLISYVGEQIITGAALSSGDRSNLDSYWQTKWGL